jgi:hypothetical protein
MWYKEIPLNLEDRPVEDSGSEVSFRPLSLPYSSIENFETDILLQWIETPVVIARGVSYDIFLLEDSLKEYLLTAIVPHFARVRGIYDNVDSVVRAITFY